MKDLSPLIISPRHKTGFTQHYLFYKKDSAGFTLIELIVSMAIMAAILSVVVFNFAKNSNMTTLTTIAYDVALTLRQAQIYGISVKNSAEPNATAEFNAGYGVHFNTDSNSYITFKDNPAADGTHNGLYNDNSSDCTAASDKGECIEQVPIQQGYGVGKICTTTPGDCSASTVDITFLRPDTKAKIIFNGTGGLQPEAQIYLQSTGNNPITKIIDVQSTGQISVQDQ